MFADIIPDGGTTSDGIIDPATEILQTSNYYPFGMAWEGNTNPDPEHNYLYNGKELDTDFGLNWYHYGARMYDPAIGRFTGVDPISEQFAWVSTYNYAENEPVAHIDLHGLQSVWSTANSFYTGEGAKFQKSHPEEANAILAAAIFLPTVPYTIVGGVTLKTFAVGSGTSLLYEGIASLLIKGNLSGIDYADVTLGGFTGFWGGVIYGSIFDQEIGKPSASIFGIVGDEKSASSIAIDLVSGGIGKGLESGINKVTNSVLEIGDDLAEASFNKAYYHEDLLITARDYAKELVSVRGGTHIANRLGQKADLFENIGNNLKSLNSIRDEVRNGLIPLLQKYGNEKNQ